LQKLNRSKFSFNNLSLKLQPKLFSNWGTSPCRAESKFAIGHQVGRWALLKTITGGALAFLSALVRSPETSNKITR
jgi:hypothetical protein